MSLPRIRQGGRVPVPAGYALGRFRSSDATSERPSGDSRNSFIAGNTSSNSASVSTVQSLPSVVPPASGASASSPLPRRSSGERTDGPTAAQRAPPAKNDSEPRQEKEQKPRATRVNSAPPRESPRDAPPSVQSAARQPDAASERVSTVATGSAPAATTSASPAISMPEIVTPNDDVQADPSSAPPSPNQESEPAWVRATITRLKAMDKGQVQEILARLENPSGPLRDSQPLSRSRRPSGRPGQLGTQSPVSGADRSLTLPPGANDDTMTIMTRSSDEGKSTTSSNLKKLAVKHGWVGGRQESPIAPFVPALALRSFQLTVQDEPVCVSCEMDVALLFVDISGYSAVTRVLQSKGPYALFDAVNGYLERILDVVVGVYKGEVLKFAGDAVLCVWYGSKLANSVKAAMHCAVHLQRHAGVHPVADTDLAFRVHIGLTCGPVTSMVLRSAVVRYMEPHFHFVSGEPVRDIGPAVELAKPGEIVASKAAIALCCVGMDLTPIPGNRKMMRVNDIPKECTCRWHERVVTGLANPKAADPATSVDDLSDFDFDDLEDAEEAAEFEEDLEHRLENTEKFIHPAVRRKLKLGLLQSQLAEMRLLSVLFIKKRDEAIDVADWFGEVQRVIDDFRCPILQLIDDDKGVHIVAAINLFTADREPAVTGVQLAQRLVAREAGCAIGMATGVTFCGVVGNKHASRWDVTGWACVRAARLMQEASRRGEAVLVDASVMKYANDQSLLVPAGTADLKGSKEPVPVYRINQTELSVLSSIISATRLCETVHVAQVELIRKDIIADLAIQRHCVVVHGCGGSGKASVCVRGVYKTGFVPLVHFTVENSPTLAAARTLARWFSNHCNSEISAAAERVLDAVKAEHNIRATALAVELVNTTVVKGCRTALIIRQGQGLDATSISFLRQMLNDVSEGTGRFLVFITVSPTFGLGSPKALQAQIAGAGNIGVTTLMEVAALRREEVRALGRHCAGWAVTPALENTLHMKTGRVAACVAELVKHMQTETGIVTVSRNGTAVASSEALQAVMERSWTEISPTISMQAAQRLDTSSQTSRIVLKVLATLHTPYAPVTKALLIVLATRIVSNLSPGTVRKDLSLLREVDIINVTTPDHDDDADEDDAESQQDGIESNADTTAILKAIARRQAISLRAMTNAAVVSGAGRAHDRPGSIYAQDCDDDEFFDIVNPAMQDVVLSTTLGEQRKQVCRMATRVLCPTGEPEDDALPEELLSLGHYYHFSGEAADIEHARQLFGQGWAAALARANAAMQSSDDEHRESVRETTQWIAGNLQSDLLAKGLTTAQCGIDASTLDEWGLGSQSMTKSRRVDERFVPMGRGVLECRRFVVPLSLGAGSMTLRLTAQMLCRLAVSATSDTNKVPQADIDDLLAKVAKNVRQLRLLDKLTGYRPIVRDEVGLFQQWLRTDVTPEEAEDNASEFLEFVMSVVRRRVERLHEYIDNTMAVPVNEDDSLWPQADRRALSNAMSRTLSVWRSDPIVALRNGILELATQGWLPVNPDLTLEFQRDAYLMHRSHDPFCFLCLMFVNLSLSKSA